ncbi:TetR/AcrR family transcriptional regulator [Sinisalibacter lacisalsi]|uniref:TetR family transcriptional regulator n=1 Tax=Sinisalibacter lacisalsi TaxID=1526570 RepID=A0ABQ1QKK8_9RHOB|nr:TetR family transcriptional regulator C-terminal domain-containing protein [Sinisalibacter lacisalsi]GGD28168.1 TetR family transcriptional regulator [Sinisalibacter lacisalsi]
MERTKSKARPRTAPPEVRRKQLIDATITCVSKYGISGTTLIAVTREAGLSLGLANFHFKSKDALLAETLNALAEEHRALWMKALDRPDLTAADKLRAMVDAQFHPRVCSRKKLAVWFAFFGEAAYRKSYRLGSSHIDIERQEISADLCREIIAEGGYEGVDPEGVSHTLESLFDGFWLNMLMYPVKFRREDAARRVFTYLAAMFPDHFAAHG